MRYKLFRILYVTFNYTTMNTTTSLKPIDPNQNNASEPLEKISVSIPLKTGRFSKMMPHFPENMEITIPESLTATLEKVGLTSDKYDQLSSEISAGITEFRSTLKSFASKIENFTEASQASALIEKIISLVTAIAAAYLAKDLTVRALIITSWVTANGLISKLVVAPIVTFLTPPEGDYLPDLRQDAFAFKREGLAKFEIPIKQGKDKNPVADETLWQAFVHIMKTFLGVEDKTQIPLNEKRAKKLGTFVSTANGLDNLFQRAFKYIKHAFEAIFELTHGYPWKLRKDQQLLRDINSVIKTAVVLRHLPEKYLDDPSIQFVLTNAIQKVDQIDSDRDVVKALTNARTYQIASKELLAKHKVVQLMLSSADRVRPIWVHLDGDPGVGKSELTKYLMMSFCKTCLGMDVANVIDTSMLYSYNPSSPYFEKYTGQPVFMVDDIFQLDDSKTRALMAELIIHFVSNVPYPLNMAALETKGAVYFTSNLIITTGNHINFTNLALADTRAFERRIDFWIECDLKEKTASNDSLVAVENWSLQIHPRDEWTKVAHRRPPLKSLPRIELSDLIKQIHELHVRLHNKQKDSRESTVEFANSFDLKPTVTEKSAHVQTVLSKLKEGSSPPAIEPSHLDCEQDDDTTSQDDNSIETVKPKLNKNERSFFKRKPKVPKEIIVKQMLKRTVADIPVDKYSGKPVTTDDAVAYFGNEMKIIRNLFQSRQDYALDGQCSAPALTEFTLPKANPVFIAASTIIAAFGLTAGIALLFRHLRAPKDEEKAIKAAYENNEMRVKAKRTSPARKLLSNIQERAITQMSDTSAISVINIAAKQTYPCSIFMSNEAEFTQHGSFVFGRVFQCTQHFLVLCEEPDFSRFEITLSPEKKIVMTRSQMNVLYSAEKDVGWVNCLIPSIQPYRDISNHYINSEAELVDASTAPVLMLRCGVAKNEDVIMSAERVSYMETVQAYDDPEEDTADSYNCIFQVSGRSIATTKGECGSPFVTKSNKVTHKIIGFLCAGSYSFSYCQIIFADELALVKEKFGYNEKQMKKLPALPAELNAWPLPTKPVPRVPEETNIRQSAIYGKIIDPIRKPAKLTPFKDKNGTFISPAEKAVLKAIRPDIKLEETDYLLYEKCVEQAFNECILPTSVPIVALPVNEALNVPKGYSHVSPVYTDTSAGYHSDEDYGTFARTSSQKPDFIQFKCSYCALIMKTTDAMYKHCKEHHHGRPVTFIRRPTELLLIRMKLLMDIALNRVPRGTYETYVVDWLKDELRPIDRVEAGKTRLFSGMTVEMLALCRCMFLDQIECEIDNHNNPTSSSGYGLNPESVEWAGLKNKLVPTTDPEAIDAIIACDIKAQDASTTSDQSRALNKVERHFYEVYESDDIVEIIPGYPTTKNERIMIRQWLNEEIYFNRVHIFFGQCYRPKHGNPSGHLRTTPSNSRHTRSSLIFSVVKYCRWFGIPCTVEDAAKSLPASTFGDDHIAAVLASLRQIGFGQGAVKHFFKQLGYEITDFRKDEFEIDTKTLQPIGVPNLYSLKDVEFLKRGFRLAGSSCYGPLKKELIEDTTNWVNKDADAYEGTLIVCIAALCNSYHHGRTYFDDLKCRINSALRSIGSHVVSLTFDQVYANFHRIRTNNPMPHITMPGFEQERPVFQMKKARGIKHKPIDKLDPKIFHPRPARFMNPPPADPKLSTFIEHPQPKKAFVPYEPSDEESSDEELEYIPLEVEPAAPLNADAELRKATENMIKFKQIIPKFEIDTIISNHDDSMYHVLLPNGAIASISFPSKNSDEPLNQVHNLARAVWFGNTNPMFPKTWNQEDLDSYVHAVLRVDSVTTSHVDTALMTLVCPDHGSECLSFCGKLSSIPWERFFPPWIRKPSVARKVVSPVAPGVKIPVSAAPSPDWITRLQMLSDRFTAGRPVYTYESAGPSHCTQYICTVSLSESTAVSRPQTTKKYAKRDAARILYQALVAEPAEKQSKEAETKSTKGLISDVTSSVSRLGHTLSMLPIIGGVASKASSVLDKVTPILRGFNLDYPTSVQAAQPIIVRQTSSLAHTKGLDSVEKLSTDPNNQVSNDMSFYCEPVSSSSFAMYKLRPALVNVNDFDGSVTQNTVLFKLPINPMYVTEVATRFYAITPLANLASYFRYWRGGFKFKIVFTTSKFVTVRVRIEWHPDPSTIATFSNDNSGDVVSLTVDICGDTDVCFTVPYLKDTPWLVVPDPAFLHNETDDTIIPLCNGYLAMRVVIPAIVANSDADSTVDYAVFMAGAEDFTIARPIERWSGFDYTTTFTAAKEKPVKQMSSKSATLQAEFRNVFKALVPAQFSEHDNVLQGEVISTFPELMHRYTSVSALATGSNTLEKFIINPWRPTTAENDRSTQWAQFQNSFLFHRGNVRYKLLITDISNAQWLLANCVSDPYGQADSSDDGIGLRRGATWMSTVFRNVVECEVPFYGIFPFATQINQTERFELPCAEVSILSAANSIKSFRTLLATGDNYTCGQVCAPGYWHDLTSEKPEKAIKQMSQTGHGNTDRQVVETTIQESDQLSSFRDQVGVKEAPMSITTTIHRDSDPYADQGLKQVLSRPYLTHSFAWSGTAATATLLHTLSYPIDLCLVPNIAEKLNRFQYFRSPVHCEVRLNSTTFHSGKLLIVYAPHWNPSINDNGAMSQDDMYSLVNLETILMSANSNETVTFDIPYVAPSTYLNLQMDTSTGTQGEGFFGTVKIFVLAPLRLTGSTTTPSVTVTVYSSFGNPEVAGFTTKSIVTRKANKPESQLKKKK